MRGDVLLLCCAQVMMGMSPRMAHGQRSSADTLRELSIRIETHPDSTRAHERYVAFVRRVSTVATASVADEAWIVARDAATRQLAARYDSLLARYPSSAAVEYGYALVYTSIEDPRARAHLMRALALNESLAPAHELLYRDYERRGDMAEARRHLQRAAELDSMNADYAFYLASAYAEIDMVRHSAMVQRLVARFPTSQRSAQALLLLAGRTSWERERDEVIDRLRALFPPEQNRWAMAGMVLRYERLLRSNPAAAAALAEEMQRVPSRDSLQWKARSTLARQMASIRSALASNQFAVASTELTALKLERGSTLEELVTLLRANALNGEGKVRQAFDTVLARFARTPSDTLHRMLQRLGSDLRFSAEQTDSAVRVFRQSNARPAPAFQLATYTPGDSVSLDKLRGRVVLITFWFPGCGPCRAEFPAMQRVMNKFGADRVAYLGVNVAPDQDEYVPSFMSGTEYTFTPLRGTDKWAYETFKVRGEPSNFLIDQHGRIVFSAFRITDENERELELMIEGLLGKDERGGNP